MKNTAKIGKEDKFSLPAFAIARLIDQTNIKANATVASIKKTCREAKIYGFRGVCVNPGWVKLVKNELGKADIKIVCLIDPPIGQSRHSKRVKICKKAKRDGADELDVVVSILDVKEERWEKILKDLKEISKILPTKVIIGSGYLTDQEIIKVSRIVKKAGAICVKTATEKDPLEHRELKEKFHHLKLMKKGAPGLLIKVAGKIKNLSDAKEAIKAGADIIGTSSGVKIMKEAEKI